MSINTATGEIIYSLDGDIANATKSDGATTISGLGWAIGNDGSAGSSRDFDGRIDDLAVWKNALTANDLENIYLNGLRGKSITDTPFGITSFFVNEDGSIILTWHSKPGRTYRVSATTDLRLPFRDWPISIEEEMVADNKVSTILLPKGFISPVGPKAFFAVQEIE
jgi:hypothetical protein